MMPKVVLDAVRGLELDHKETPVLKSVHHEQGSYPRGPRRQANKPNGAQRDERKNEGSRGRLKHRWQRVSKKVYGRAASDSPKLRISGT